KFKKALDANTHKAFVDSESAVADKAGISGTPAFVINGYFISGAQPFAKFKKIIDKALAEAGVKK
ncbi:MAG: DsbA family protein, partial [Byssovorax sp.]